MVSGLGWIVCRKLLWILERFILLVGFWASGFCSDAEPAVYQSIEGMMFVLYILPSNEVRLPHSIFVSRNYSRLGWFPYWSPEEELRVAYWCKILAWHVLLLLPCVRAVKEKN